MLIRAHLLQEFDSDFVESMREQLNPGIELTAGDMPNPSEFEILIAGVPSREDLVASPNLHTLIIPWAGLPRSTRELLLEFPQIAVHNSHHNAVATAESALALMFAAVKETVPIDRKLRQGDWSARYVEDRCLLYGRTALIVGYGAIGKHIAKVCVGLGMKVLATRRSPSESEENEVTVYSADKLSELLLRADVLILSLPSTPETVGLIGARELALLRDGSTLINISRGAVVDEKALYDALASGRLRAGLDVWYNYPKSEEQRSNTMPANYPFHELDNVVMSPHLGGLADRTEELRAADLAEMLNAAAAGKPLPNRVDIQRGY